MPALTTVQLRRGTSSEWSASLNALAQGEMGYDLTSKKIKVGDGSSLWDSLPWATIVGTDLVGTSGINISYASNSGIATVSVTGLTSSYLSDFASAVSGLLPVKNILAGANISVSGDNGSFTISSSGVDANSVKDIIGSSISGVSGVSVSYDSGSKLTTINITGIPASLINDLNSIATTDVVGRTGIALTYDSMVDKLYIDTTGVSFTGHSHSWSNITDASSYVTLSELGYLSGVSTGTASANRAVVLDSNKDITGLRNINTEGDVTVGGNLIIQGTTTTVNSNTVDIGDNIIRVNTSGLTTGGFEVYTGSDTKSLTWNVTNNRWEFTGADIYTTGSVIANSIQVSSNGLVNNLNSDLLDGQHGSYYTNFSNLTGVPSPVISGSLTGDITGSATVTLNQLGNGLLTINTNIAAASIVDSDISSSAAINVAKLSNSGITLGSTTINLGATELVLRGLSSISGTSLANPTVLYNCVIDGGTP